MASTQLQKPGWKGLGTTDGRTPTTPQQAGRMGSLKGDPGLGPLEGLLVGQGRRVVWIVTPVPTFSFEMSKFWWGV